MRQPTLLCRILPLLLLTFCAGCSSLIPGLNVYPGDPGSHPYSRSRTDEYGKCLAKAGAPPQYVVIPLNAHVISALAGKQVSPSGSQLQPLLPSDVPPEYRLGPGDVFFVVVWDHPELTAPYTGLTNDLGNQGRLIASDGTAFYPYVGTFEAAGMTSGGLRNFLTHHLAAVIQNPQVDVRIVAYRADRVEVTGEVAKPATLTLDDTPKGVIEAIDASGGLTLAASRRRAILVRKGVAYNIDLAGLLSGSRPVANPSLEPGDVLHLPDQSGDQIMVLGAVDKPAPVVLQQATTTLINALTQAGGIDKLIGKQSGILIFRPAINEDGRKIANVYTLDMSRPEGVLLASEFELQPSDVVYVQATEFSQYNAIINDLLPTVTTFFELHQLTK